MKNSTLLFFALLTPFVGFVALREGKSQTLLPEQVVHRKIEIKGFRFRNGNVTTYRIPLERDTLYAHETDNNLGFSVGSPLEDDSRFAGATPRLDTFNVEVEKNEKGRISRYEVTLGKVRYYDLNGDGHFDRMVDLAAKRNMIILDGRFVDVQDSLTAGGSAKSLDGRTSYTFQKSAWKVVSQR